MTRIDGPARQHIYHNPEPDAAGAEHAGKTVEGGKTKSSGARTAPPAEPMSKTRRQAVDGLVKRQTPKSQRDTIRAALAKNPGLADHYVALRLRGRNRIEHQIVHTVLARSGTTGVQRLAMCESAVRQIHALGRSQQADVLGLVTMGVSVHSAIAQLESKAQSGKAEAAQKSQQSMSRKIDGAVQSLKNEAGRWNKTANEVNALYRQVPTLTRQAEVTVGVVNATATPGDLAVAGAKFQYTLDGHAFDEALDKADRSAGYMFGDFTHQVNEARTLHTEFSNQHIAYIEQNHRMQRAVKSGDFQTQLDARSRMDKLAAGMKATVARFRPIAEKTIRMDEHFNEDTKAAAKHVVETGATADADGLGKTIEGVNEGIEEGLKEGIKDGLVDKGVEAAGKGVAHAFGAHPQATTNAE